MIPLGSRGLEILNYFSAGGTLSAYDVHSRLKSSDRGIAYKNVHSRIQRLRSLELITEIKKDFNPHRAKFYQLSLRGIFHLIRNNDINKLDPSLISTCYKSPLFGPMLEPYFDLKTITEYSLICHLVLRYLKHIAEDSIESIRYVSTSDRCPKDGAIGFRSTNDQLIPQGVSKQISCT